MGEYSRQLVCEAGLIFSRHWLAKQRYMRGDENFACSHATAGHVYVNMMEIAGTTEGPRADASDSLWNEPRNDTGKRQSQGVGGVSVCHNPFYTPPGRCLEKPRTCCGEGRLSASAPGNSPCRPARAALFSISTFCMAMASCRCFCRCSPGQSCAQKQTWTTLWKKAG